jgi:hypothetical protein
LAVVPVSCFRHQTDTDHSAKKIRGGEFRDCTHFFWSFSLFFAPKLRATSAPIGPRERVAERVRTQALSQLSNLLFTVERSRVTCPLPDMELASPARKAQRFKMSNGLQEAAMDRFVSRENIRRYRKLVSESTDATERSQIMKMLAEEETKFKLELRRGGDPPRRKMAG